MERQRIYSLLGKINDDDRSQMVCLPAKAGYAVRIGRERPGNKGQMQYYIEYWKEDEN